MTSPILLWFRRDLRLVDHPALLAAAETGRPIVPVFIYDEWVEELGAAPRFRLELSLAALAKDLEAYGSRLVLRRGDAMQTLQSLIADTGATAVYWTRAYDPLSIGRDKAVKAKLTQTQIEARSFAGHLLFEPWTVETKTGGFYRVYTPYWKAVRDREVAQPLPAPKRLSLPDDFPTSDRLEDWHLADGMDRGAAIVAGHACVGATAAQERLELFVAGKIADYATKRDFPAHQGTSGLSENLTWGEISIAQCWHAGFDAWQTGGGGAETFLKELVWRDFAYHLAYHTPHIVEANWREEWNAFPWNSEETDEVVAWKHGRTGVPFVDAAMREMYVTGKMHNRARMIVASYLTKHLLSHWKIGQAWFEECLTDWDPASNAMGWQWAAGSGPDAAPYFRVFNPVSQLEKFDKPGAYADRWIAEGRSNPHADALSYFAAIPRSWGLSPDDRYPDPVVALDEGRKRALAAYESRSKSANG